MLKEAAGRGRTSDFRRIGAGSKAPSPLLLPGTVKFMGVDTTQPDSSIANGTRLRRTPTPSLANEPWDRVEKRLFDVCTMRVLELGGKDGVFEFRVFER